MVGVRKFDACLHFKQQFISLNEQFKILNGDEKAIEFRGVITLKTQFCPHQARLLLIVARFVVVVVVSKKEGFLRRQKGKQNERCSIEADVCR